MKLGHLVVAVAAVIAFGACTNEKLVYVNRPFNPPPDSVSGFLGYFDVATQQTTCGNCHVEHQTEWKATKHAQAWSDLQALAQPADKSSCVGCHTVSPEGNLAPSPSGYTLVQNAAYHDVQCESCHGAGFDHASVPDAGTAPLASIAVDTTKDPAIASAVGTCAACHQDTHHPFWEEWRQSIHANMGRHNGEAYCEQCHSGQGALAAWGVTTSYKEMGARNQGITCSVCHNPHGSPNPAQLRWPLATLDRDQQLCMKCHNRRTTPQILDSLANPVQTGANSPHAPQGSVVVGDVGYQNPAYLDPVVTHASTHANLTKNPKLCAGCHLYSFPAVNDAGIASTVTGHLFRPIPCYGPDGLPTDSIKNCAYTPGTPGTFGGRSFKACAASGCHGDEATAAGLLSVARGRIQSLTAALWVNSNAASSGIDTLDSGILPAILKNTWSQRGTLNNLSLQARGAFLVGDTIINLTATAVTGKLAVTNTFKINGDATTYTVQATVTAATNRLDGVRITPPLAQAVANTTPVYVIFMGPLVTGDRVVTPVDGAEFNVRLFGEDATGNFITTSQSGADRSHTVHNPFLAEAMLRANIDELTDLYGLQPWFPTAPAAVQRILAGPLGASGSVPFPRPAGRRTASR